MTAALRDLISSSGLHRHWCRDIHSDQQTNIDVNLKTVTTDVAGSRCRRSEMYLNQREELRLFRVLWLMNSLGHQNSWHCFKMYSIFGVKSFLLANIYSPPNSPHCTTSNLKSRVRLSSPHKLFSESTAVLTGTAIAQHLLYSTYMKIKILLFDGFYPYMIWKDMSYSLLIFFHSIKHILGIFVFF